MLKKFFNRHAKAIFFGLAGVAIFSVSMLATIIISKGDLSKEEREYIKNAPPSKVDLTKDYQSIVFAGFGGASHSGGGLADSITQVVLDTESKKAYLVAIPRDTNVPLPIRSDMDEYRKINDSYAIGNSETLHPLKQNVYSGEHGGGKLLKVAVQRVTGVSADYYAAINFNNFVALIDELGGVNVNVPVAFVDEYFPIKGNEELLCEKSPEEMVEIHEKYSGFELEKQFKCRYETLTFAAGETQMDGVTALKFIRSRHSNNHGGDFARGERAQAVLIGIFSKLLSLDALANLDKTYINLSKLVSTDLGINDAKTIAELVQMPQTYEIINLNITKDNFLVDGYNESGQYILDPMAAKGNFKNIHQYIFDNIQ